ncbi:MAG TPA: hypothetical protein DDY32_04870 [Desulfobulbaceae bacterium]|nr:hypothetical protein [Desulfobulbaceae bacterium]
MISARLKTVAKKWVVLFACLVCAVSLFRLAGFFTLSCQAGEGIAPDRIISVVASEPTTPEWKVIWDKARNLARREAYGQAASLYSTLFQLKPNIEEATWEYCKVLLKIENYAAVKKILPGLLEKTPDRSEYLFAAGQLAVHEKDWTLAARYYGKVLERDPAGELADGALEGLASSLKAQGRKEAAFTLLEQVIARKPRRMDLLQEGALTAQQLGYTHKARKLYERLLATEKVDDRVIFSAANAFDTPGYEQKSSLLWSDYLKSHPDYLPFRRKLVDYHVKAGNYQEAIPHIAYLAEHLDNNDEFLLKAGTVNLHQLRRPDKALGYLERYLKKHPDDMAVKQQIVDIQAILARELLSIVENDGAELLWKDLTEVTANRAAIYLAMADLLERKGSDKSLLEVLTILHHNSPDNDALSWRIACQYYRGEQYRQALGFLQKVHNKETKTKAYYAMRGKTEKILGMEMAALSSFEGALAIDPGDNKLRKICLELAGKIGLVGRMEVLFAQGTKNNGHPDDDLLLTYLDQLSRNFLFRQYERVSERYAVMLGADRRLIDRLDIIKAHVLRREGRNRGAEQLLRRMLAEERSVKEVLFTLTDNAIADRNLNAAEIWYQTLVQRSVGQGSEFSHDEEGSRRLLRKVRILKNAGEYEQARGLIRTYENERQQGNSSALSRLSEELERERCWLNYYLGEYKETLKTVQSLDSGNDFEPELYILSRLLARKLKLASTTGKELETRLIVNDHPSLTRIIDVIDLELVYKQYDLIERHLQAVVTNCPESVAGNLFFVRFYLTQGKFEEAVELLTKLIEAFPEEPYFTKKLIEIEVKRGRYDRGLAVFKKWKNLTELDTFMTEESSSQDIEETLTLARLLWGNKQQEKALKVYERLLTPTVLELLQATFSRQQINYLYLNREKSLWNSMMLMLQSEPELVTELMEPEFLVNNLTNAAGGIVASHYELYSWQKMISNEYQARKAIFERNYSSAEQSYKRLLDEEKTAEGMIDLAAVYGRTGKYRKEAQVYEALQNTGATSPELVSSLERSSIQMSPQNLFDVGYEEKEGRDGFIDLTKLSVGTSFQFTPDLDKDIRLSYSNNRYESINSSESAASNLLYGSAGYEFAKDYELSFGGGTEKLDGTSDARFLYAIAAKGQLDQYFNAYLAWQKSLIYDTVTAIKENISAQGIETGLTCETPVGISFGGDFRHLNYSDGNLQNRFHGFSSYGLYGENIHLSLRYDYQYLNNTDANPVDRLALEEETVQDGIFYWSPESFSEHLMTLHYQHDFLGYQQGKKQGVSYYSIDNAVGSEPDGIVSFTGKFNIFLEMNPHFLLKGNFTFATSDDYEEKGLSLSLHYRW